MDERKLRNEIIEQMNKCFLALAKQNQDLLQKVLQLEKRLEQHERSEYPHEY